MKTWTSILVIGCLCMGSLLRAQTGTEFWFAAPEVTAGNSDQPVYLRLSNSNGGVGVTVTVSIPANPAFTPLVVAVAASSAASIDLTPYLSTIEHTTPNAVASKALRIVATGNITAYYEVKSANRNMEIFPLKGENALGRTFLIPSQTTWANHSGFSPLPYSGFIVVATEDNTTVTITPSQSIVGHLAGVPFSVTLDKGESYVAQATSQAAAAHLAGSTVQASDPIAVTLYDDSGYNAAYGTGKDLMGDQLTPINSLGDAYIVVKGFLSDASNKSLPDHVYILAVSDNTQIYLDGSGTPLTTLQSGEQYDLSLSNNTAYLTGSKPFSVLHVTGFGSEVAMGIVPPLFCAGGSRLDFTRPATDDFYMIILVPAPHHNQFMVNGNSSSLGPSDFTFVPGTGNTWYYCRKSFTNTQITTGSLSTVRNKKSDFHLGILNGTSTSGCRYGYLTNFNTIPTNQITHY